MNIETMGQRLLFESGITRAGLAFLAASLLLAANVAASTGEVFLRDGSWQASVNGETVYQGDRMFDAVNAVCEAAGAGATINIRDSGESGPNPGAGVYSIRPLDHQTLDFHGNTIHCNGGDLVVAVFNDERDGITVLNLRVTGNPRYGLWFRGCNDLTLDNITIEHTGDSPVGLGIRVASSSTGRNSPVRASGLTIGTVTISGTRTHAVETFSVDNIRVDRVNASDIPLGSGLQINDGRDVWIRSVYGERVATESTYATVRFANVTRDARIDYIHSRGSARGFYNMGNVNGARVGYVDIADSRVSGVSIHSEASNVQVFDGVVVNSNNDVDIWSGATDVCIRVNGEQFGDACDFEIGETVSEGVYRVVARHSGKVMEIADASTESDGPVRQAPYIGGDRQHWRIVAAGENRFRLQNVESGQWLTFNGDGGIQLAGEEEAEYQDFVFIPTMGGEYRIMPANRGGTVEVAEASGEDGATVTSGAYEGASHQQWRLEPPELAMHPRPTLDHKLLNGDEAEVRLVIGSWQEHAYRLQRNKDLSQSGWVDAGPVLAGTGGEIELYDAFDSLPARMFYRVVIQPGN